MPLPPLHPAQTEAALREFAKKASQPPRPKSAFERIKLGQNNFIDTTGDTVRRLKSTAKATTKPKPKERHIAAAQLEEPQYSLELRFSSEADSIVKSIPADSTDGKRSVTYTEPLVNPGTKTDNTGRTVNRTAEERTYQIQVRLTQHHAGQLFQGVALEWHKPAGWTWMDGKGDVTYHEFVSNPVVVLRIARYDSGEKGWRVITKEWYR